MTEKYIYHITTKTDWEAQMDSKAYQHPSLFDENFIHCSFEMQVPLVRARYFAGVVDLLLLKIDTELLRNKLLIEQATNDEMYPHVYGTINKTAIVEVKEL
jgi:uncharacterized protein (DUF952 family)